MTEGKKASDESRFQGSLIQAVRDRATFTNRLTDTEISAAIVAAARECSTPYSGIEFESGWDWDEHVVKHAVGRLMTMNLGNEKLDEAVEQRREKNFGEAVLRIMSLEAQGQYPDQEELAPVVEWLEGMLTPSEAQHAQRLRAQKQAVHMGIEAFESQMQVRFGRTIGVALAHRLMRPRNPDPPHVPSIRIIPADRPE